MCELYLLLPSVVHYKPCLGRDIVLFAYFGRVLEKLHIDDVEYDLLFEGPEGMVLSMKFDRQIEAENFQECIDLVDLWKNQPFVFGRQPMFLQKHDVDFFRF